MSNGQGLAVYGAYKQGQRRRRDMLLNLLSRQLQMKTQEQYYRTRPSEIERAEYYEAGAEERRARIGEKTLPELHYGLLTPDQKKKVAPIYFGLESKTTTDEETLGEKIFGLLTPEQKRKAALNRYDLGDTEKDSLGLDKTRLEIQKLEKELGTKSDEDKLALLQEQLDSYNLDEEYEKYIKARIKSILEGITSKNIPLMFNPEYQQYERPERKRIKGMEGLYEAKINTTKQQSQNNLTGSNQTPSLSKKTVTRFESPGGLTQGLNKEDINQQVTNATQLVKEWYAKTALLKHKGIDSTKAFKKLTNDFKQFAPDLDVEEFITTMFGSQ